MPQVAELSALASNSLDRCGGKATLAVRAVTSLDDSRRCVHLFQVGELE